MQIQSSRYNIYYGSRKSPRLPTTSAIGGSGMPVLLEKDAWKLGEMPDERPRSRYSGVALYPDQMAITIIVSWAELFGHSHIAFEWFADEMPGPRTSQR